MSAVALAISRTHRRTRRSARSRRTAPPRGGGAILLVAVAAATIGYLALANGNAAAGYELRALERRADALREEVRQLELASLNAQSMDAMTAKIADQGFIPVARVEFVSPDRAVAVK